MYKKFLMIAILVASVFGAYAMLDIAPQIFLSQPNSAWFQVSKSINKTLSKHETINAISDFLKVEENHLSFIPQSVINLLEKARNAGYEDEAFKKDLNPTKLILAYLIPAHALVKENRAEKFFYAQIEEAFNTALKQKDYKQLWDGGIVAVAYNDLPVIDYFCTKYLDNKSDFVFSLILQDMLIQAIYTEKTSILTWMFSQLFDINVLFHFISQSYRRPDNKKLEFRYLNWRNDKDHFKTIIETYLNSFGDYKKTKLPYGHEMWDRIYNNVDTNYLSEFAFNEKYSRSELKYRKKYKLPCSSNHILFTNKLIIFMLYAIFNGYTETKETLYSFFDFLWREDRYLLKRLYPLISSSHSDIDDIINSSILENIQGRPAYNSEQQIPF